MNVFDSSFSTLEQHFSSQESKDFAQLGQLHADYLNSIQSGLFLDNDGQLVQERLTKAFRHCNLFCEMIDKGKLDDIDSLVCDFEKNTGELVQGFVGGRKPGKGLEEFLTRVDFNRWYSVGKRFY